MKKLLGHVLLLGLLLTLVWAVGLIGFITLTGIIPSYNPAPEKLNGDVVVVLTGGSERIEAGVDILKQKRAKQLFISGVYKGATVALLLNGQKVPDELRTCCITLGFEAPDTTGNAQETAAWLKDKPFTSIILVTAHYHMPRSLLEFRRVMPETTITPYAVAPARVKVSEWWNSPKSARLLVEEYHKLLAAFVRFSIDKFS